MDIISLVFSILGFVTGVIGVCVSVYLTRRTKAIEKDVNKKFSVALSVMHFNETKKEHIGILLKTRNSISSSISNEINPELWNDLDLVLKRIKTDLHEMNIDNLTEIDATISNIFALFADSEIDNHDKNMQIISNLNEIIAYLESYKHLGGQ